MKKIIALLLAIIMLAGCSSVSQADYDAVVKERDELKAQVEQLENSQSLQGSIENEMFHSEPTLSKTIDLDETNQAIVMIYENQTPKSAGIVCTFDGADPELEYARLVAFMLFFQNLQIKDYMLSSMVSGDDTQATIILCKNGEFQTPNMMSEKYKSLFINEMTKELREVSVKEYGNILEQLNENAPATDNSNVTKNTFIHDDNYVKIEYVGCQKENSKDEIVFKVENKTDVELTFQCDAFALDGNNVESISGSDGIAAKSNGKIRYYSYDGLPTLTPKKITGTIRVVDFSETLNFKTGRWSYDVRFVNTEIL